MARRDSRKLDGATTVAPSSWPAACRDVDVVAEHGAGIAVLTGYRCAGEGHEGRIGQCITQVLGVANLVFLPAGLAFELASKPVLVRCASSAMTTILLRSERTGKVVTPSLSEFSSCYGRAFGPDDWSNVSDAAIFDIPG